ncbi:hypothetical protein QYE76_067645 [Lolium multiflorum]|uniref:Retrotransposon gag domain-containing protein n=1 Tax=Lolium multiflorum TaxID=4521 RepID=A0AAD8SD08_LOLMU|nr:hypothetical protein QYE76_067645 [Lolium multiflorum]
MGLAAASRKVFRIVALDDGGSQKGKKRGATVGPDHRPARPMAWPRHPVGYSRLCGAENTREKRALRRAGIRRGNSLPEGEIDAIAIVIERDIISIIIIIISTIYTAITTAAPRHRCISMNEVRKKLFTISLSGKAAHWYKLLKNGDSIDWEDIVPLFYSKFYPPSEIHKDRNRIYNFWPHDGESIAQAWGRLKSLMLKCPIHELPGNVIIDNFYARLSFQDKTLLDTSCSGSFTRNKEEFKRDLLDRIQENTEGWENDKDRESGIIYDYKCIEAFMDTDKFRNMSATYGLDSQVVANLYKAFASHYELPKKNFDKYHEPYKDKVDSSVNKCVVIETVDNVIPEAYIEKTPFPAKMKEYSVISSAVNKSEKKPKEPEEQIKIEPAVAIVKDLVTENVEDGHIIFCEDASNIVSHPNKPKQVSVPMLSVRIGDHCYYGLCDIGASVSAIPYELYTEIMHEIGSCELEDIDVVIHLANRETISPIGIVRDVEVLCGSFLDATIAKSRQIENTETPNENAATPVNSPESVEYSSDDLDEDYVELDDDFIEKCNATTDARKIKKLLAEHAVRYKLSPDPKFATSPINIRDKDYDFSLDLSHIAIVEKTPFCGTEKESAVEHMTELSTLSGLFSDDIKMRTYFVAKFFPFSLKDDAKTWYNNLPPGSIKSPKELLDVFFRKYFPASAQHAALQRIYNFDQEDGEKLPEAWARFCSLIRAQPDHDLEKHDLLDIFYSGLTIESRAYLDSCAGCVFRKRTPDDAEELLAKIGRNHDDWSTIEPTPTPIVKKRGMIKLNDEDMREAKKSLKEKGIKPEDVKNLPPIEDLCEITPPSSMIEVHSLQRFTREDIPYSKPPAQCLDEFDNYIVKQENFNMRVENHLMENSRAISELHGIVERTSNDVKILVKHFQMVQTQIDQLTKVQNDLLGNNSKEKHAYEVTTRGGVSTQDPLYPEGHPKRIEQDSQLTKTSAPSKKKKKKHKNVVESSEPVNDPNSISISDAETESGNEHDKDNDKNDTPDKEEIEKEPEKPAKNKKYTKEDFITEKHGNEREPWVQKQMPFPAKKLKSKEEEHYNKFCDWMKPLFLQIPLTDAIKLPPYSKYMKDIVTNKRKIPNEEISTMLANYSFNGKIPKKLGDPGIPTIPCSIKNNYVRTALCDLGAGVSVMPFSLYKRLDLDKLIPTDISLQMADKSTAIPVGLCENVPVQVTQHCLILTDFVVLEMPEDDNMSIILGRPFLNTAGAVIDCNKGMVTFNVDDKEHTVYFPKRIDKKGKMKKFKFGELFKKATTSTGRPSRASTQIRRSYNEDVIAPSFAPEEDNGAPNASSFPCYDFLTNAGILDDFFTLVNRAGLATYVGDEREQYYRLTKVFVESFKFHNTQYEPTVAFKIYDIPVTMKLEEFCRALDIAPVGTARRIDDNPRDLLELYRGITGDDCRTIQRGKIRNIQLPAIKYFAYYIATSILGRENTSNISSYHLAFLNAALTGETSYHLGSLIARRLSSRGPIFGGTIALRILTHLEIPLDSNDVPLTPRRLDIAAMKSHHFVTTDSTIDNMVYRMLFADGNEKEIPLPQPGLFNIDRQSWSLTKEAVEEHMKIQEFHQQHDSENAEPSYDYTVTYPDVSSSTYLEPGRSSSYYGDTTSWGPWE